ncbi:MULTISPECIES: sulfotransferase family protein [Halorhodospira]|uniref:sulfotransferase family protein n=1 Tax=Halorhodospira TaxID=85108 RepID=UPI001EE919C4|nr:MULTISPECIES: sulfotransferase family protein [Halorhodospira]MCG5528868.1 sulfotransferase family protein [Halorhodospira halophila]MCG5544254.1 sulfotransferase family protein [Halorhodospira sp. 9628]
MIRINSSKAGKALLLRAAKQREKIENQLKTRRRRTRKTPFYVRHPFEGAHSIRSADQRGLVDFDIGIFYNRIPKAANSTVVTTIARIKENQEREIRDIKRDFLSPSELTQEQVDAFANLLKFTVVRDPYSRALSAYLDKVARGGRCPKELIKKNGSPPSFGEFCTYLEHGGLFADPHWTPQTELLLLKPIEFDSIIKMDDLATHLPSLLSRVTPNSTQDLTLHIPHQTGASSQIKNYYTSKTYRAVTELYKRDFVELDFERI